MNKHDKDFRSDELYWFGRVDRIVYWDPSISRFIRKFLDTMDEAIG